MSTWIGLALIWAAAGAAGPGDLIAWTETATRKVFLDTPPGRERAIDLAAARGEWESAQIVLRARRATLALSARAEALKGPEGAEIPSGAIELRRVAYVPVPHKGRPYPDPLPPLRGPLTVAADANAPILVTIRVPRDARPGIYRGKIAILGATGRRGGGKEIASIPVTLRVWPFAIPVTPSVKTAFGISTGHALRFEGLRPGTPEARRMQERYYWFLVEHRLSPYHIPVDLLDPEAGRFLDDPRVTGFIIPYRDDVAWMRARVGRARAEGWLPKAYFYPSDEPVSEAQYRRLRKQAARIRSIDPKLRIVSPFFRDAAFGPSAYDALDGIVTIWCSVTSYFRPDRMEEKRRAGGEVWWYVCCGPGRPYANLHISMDAIDHRILPWQMVKYRVEGLLYWSTTYWNPAHVDNPWTCMVTVPQINRNLCGDGSLLYPGRLPSGERVADGPVASLRLLLLRDGLEDLEYLALLARRRGAEAAQRAAGELVRSLTDFGKDPRDLDRLRRRIGGTLSARRREGR